jgi:hypothetical protein
MSNQNEAEIHRLTGAVDNAMVTITCCLGHAPKGSDIMFILADEVRRLREQMQWQDMKTAPKFAVADPISGFSETPYILLIDDEGEMAVGHWHCFKDTQDEYDWGDSLGRGIPIFEPIKWMPLPAAPGKGDAQ